MTGDSNIGHLEEAARKRKERLKNLKKKRETGNEENSNQQESLPKPVFRNYFPLDDKLKVAVLPKTKPESVEEQVEMTVDPVEPIPSVQEIDLTTLAPRKPDWDLKRDVAKKLEKLERRTQRAIVEIIRERINSGNENLATVVSGAVNGTATMLREDD